MTSARKPTISPTVKNTVSRFFRLYIPFSVASHLRWEDDWNSGYHFSINIAVTDPHRESNALSKILDHLGYRTAEILESPLGEKLKTLGLKIVDTSYLWSEVRQTSLHQVKCRLSKKFLDNLTADQGYPEFFTLEDYLAKSHSFLSRNIGVHCYDKMSDIFHQSLSPSEKFIKFTKTAFDYSTSFFQKDQVKSALTEFLADIPSVIHLQRERLKSLSVQGSSREVNKLVKISRLIQKHFPSPQKNVYATTLLANVIGFFSDFINKKDVTDAVEVMLGFLIKEQMSHSAHSSGRCVSFLRRSSKEREYSTQLKWLIDEIKAYLQRKTPQADATFKRFADESLLEKYNQYISKPTELCALDAKM